MGVSSNIFVLGLLVVGTFADSIIPGRRHNILIDPKGNGAFDLYFNTEKGAKIGCRGSILNGQETLQEIYLEDAAGLQRNGIMKNSQMRLMVVPNLSKDSSNSSIETLGLANFALWPRECILGLIQLHPEDLLAEESHEHIKTGVVHKKNYLASEVTDNVDEVAKGIILLPFPWWWMWPASQITDSLEKVSCLATRGSEISCGCIRGGGGSHCGGGCDVCQSCGKCAAWGPVIGGTNNSPQCSYIDIDVNRPRFGGKGKEVLSGDDVDADYVYVAAGGGGGGGGTYGGHGGNVQGSSISSIHSDGNSGLYSCNDDNMTINGIVYSGGTNGVKQ